MIFFPPHLVAEEKPRLRDFFGVFRYGGRALKLAWTTNRQLTLAMAALTLVAGLLPPAAAYVAKLIIDTVLAAVESGAASARMEALTLVGIEAVIFVALSAAQRGLDACTSLFRAQLGHRVNMLVLEKALTLELTHFEDSDTYDKITRARRDASSRPLSLVQRTFGLIQNGVTLTSFAVILWTFSGWAVLIVALAGLPAFVAEAKFSGDAFQLFRWRSPDTRRQAYLEMLMGREDYAKEVQLFELGPMLLARYRAIFEKLYDKDRDLTMRRNLWGWALGLVSIGSVSGAYAWVAMAAVRGTFSIGDMVMFMGAFKQGQSAVSASLSAISGMYEDNLYLSNLYEFLEMEVEEAGGAVDDGPSPGDGLRFEDVWFTYPGSEEATIRGVSFHLKPGRKLALVGENGAGKTTLIKLLTRLYRPGSGRIVLDGRDLKDWDEHALRRRVGVIFQDFVRYQFTAGENIGVGDVERLEDEARWQDSADKGLAAPFIDEFPKRYAEQLGRWFQDGRELSTGQWQKVALSRAFMRGDADVLVLDEPTASMDAEAEALIFDRFRALTERQMAILISHRFSTVRMADEILVIDGGQVCESGTHEALMEEGGRYARLFELQAAGYR